MGTDQDFKEFWRLPKTKYSSGKLGTDELSAQYLSSGQKFSPTAWQSVTWMMHHMYQDIWGCFNANKLTELIWDMTMKAPSFKDFLKKENEPQAYAAKLQQGGPSLAQRYDVYCFLDQETQKAVYIFMDKGEKQASACVLAVCALWKWDRVPADGKTLSSEDFEAIDLAGVSALMKWTELPKGSPVPW